MDETTDRGYSRAPELEDLVFLCRALNRERVRYILIGGFAVILQGLLRTTKDIDLLVDPSEENVRALKRALSALPDNAVALIEDDEIEKYGVVRIADEFVVDLMGKACGISYQEALSAGVDRRRIEDVEVPVASKETLILTKATSRDGDRMDIGFLRDQIEAEQRARGK